MRTLVDGGFETQSVIDAVTSGDLSRLQHSGALSVQLQEPGATTEMPQMPASNGAQPDTVEA
jgi:hypothetical protein